MYLFFLPPTKSNYNTLPANWVSAKHLPWTLHGREQGREREWRGKAREAGKLIVPLVTEGKETQMEWEEKRGSAWERAGGAESREGGQCEKILEALRVTSSQDSLRREAILFDLFVDHFMRCETTDSIFGTEGNTISHLTAQPPWIEESAFTSPPALWIF